MPYQDKKQQQAAEENKKAHPEQQLGSEQRSYGVSNGLMWSVPMTPPPGTPNSVMREMETEDRDALFRGRGFAPAVGAHELSHTVRRDSVPDGTIQRDPTKKGDSENKDQPAAAASAKEQNKADWVITMRNNIRKSVISQLDEIVALQRAVSSPNFTLALNHHRNMTNEQKNPQKKKALAKKTARINDLPEELAKLYAFFRDILRRVQDPQQNPLDIVDSIRIGDMRAEERLENCKRFIKSLELLQYVREDEFITVEKKEDEADLQPPAAAAAAAATAPVSDEPPAYVTPGASDDDRQMTAAAAAAAPVSDAPPVYGETPGASEENDSLSEDDFIKVEAKPEPEPEPKSEPEPEPEPEPESEKKGLFGGLFNRKKRK